MKATGFITLVVTTLCLSWIVVVRADEFNQKTYVESVITILRIEVNDLQNLNSHRIKYSDNLARHAIAIQHTFGLLGPMDWHAAESAKLMNKGSSVSDMDVDKFEQLERRSRLALKDLVIAAHEAMEEDNRDGLNEAITNMKNSCNACHAYLPASVAPDVWGTLKRK
jgi:hypothetical protein